MGTLSSMLARGLHALLIALAIGLIACYSVANNPSSPTNEWMRGEEKVQLFSQEIIFVCCLNLSQIKYQPIRSRHDY